MTSSAKRWALILAAGAGSRLSHLTKAHDGAVVPKQFCSLSGGASLLEETLERAHAIVSAARTVVVVAAEQRRYWQGLIAGFPATNVIVQPRNRGTANGILLGVTAIHARDPEARIAVLPSDHYVAREAVLQRALLRALRIADGNLRAVSFLGIKPELLDPELGYIVSGLPESGGGYRIAEFVEKPERESAARLLERGALWNSFILAARSRAFLDLIGRRFPIERHAFEACWRRIGRGADADAELAFLYRELRDIDFSRQVVEGSELPLRVVPVASCGWSDLGTPKRVAACLDRVPTSARLAGSTHLNLAEAYARTLGPVAAAAQWV